MVNKYGLSIGSDSEIVNNTSFYIGSDSYDMYDLNSIRNGQSFSLDTVSAVPMTEGIHTYYLNDNIGFTIRIVYNDGGAGYYTFTLVNLLTVILHLLLLFQILLLI